MIAPELHDIVSHSLSVVITLADAAAVVSRSDPDREVLIRPTAGPKTFTSGPRTARTGTEKPVPPSDDTGL
jgi:hypothetical protein